MGDASQTMGIALLIQGPYRDSILLMEFDDLIVLTATVVVAASLYVIVSRDVSTY